MSWAAKDLHRFKDHHNEARVFGGRVFVALFFVLVLFGVLIARFYSLQVVQYQDYATRSDLNRIQVRPVPPNRGLILDRNGEILALNSPSFTLSLVKERIKNLEETLAQIDALVPISDSDRESFYKLLKQRRRPYEPTPLRYNLTEEEIARIAVNEYQLNGVEIQAQLVRQYPKGEVFVHAVGYVGRINERELSRFTQEEYELYTGTHSIGKTGLERQYEMELLGRVGSENIETNALGRVLKVLDRTDPEPGKDLQLFLDSKVQQTALEQLGDQRGAVVAIDIETGGILALVSTPSYDPNLFVTGISYKDYNALNQSKDLPLFNRAIQGQYPPGSTVKPMLGLGGLESKIVNFRTTIFDPGFYQLENDERFYREWKKGGHGSRVDLREAIVESCDIYFYDLSFRMGVDKMHAFGLNFGLGSRTGLDIPSERPGNWPSRAWKKGYRGVSWYPGDSLNMSIGQGDVLATPLQLAVMTATLATRGTLIKPRLVKQIGDTPTEKEILGVLEADSANWDYVLEAMEGVVHDRNHGTARAISRNLSYRIAGKTGTAQKVGIAQDAEYESDKISARNRDHALFVGFAPADNPKIAVAAIVENGESSGIPAAIVKEVMNAYLLPMEGE
ncbi:penicillin-binding protein 2 [Saccharophagus degradans]|uniref:Peptidoglycan D,D-transpeptidase MrdA n=2 Tax=Saccharophagus degradans TaxID=86304 RepID=Q21FD3_SACD2|nr:penicillin-binding protein 2 [Saccharophagus degradans]ABD82596.1 PAS/PAC sensor signal transduction histidine kinase / peptidoglycan glycosyltransferase [Saccharophagus degradans 2-40]MBU2987005.1 penicillin-binding protein 2 [Saccharophagus degradans]MDO6424409.1 penicillin-binding protein 2 [Saccharophagus degradans]MDO6608384.1 penicillin-binding protein 2 [Saccharophagus degradans]WGO99223.1 penicillin-binding protein 2 [Saccharophagus degradans]